MGLLDGVLSNALGRKTDQKTASTAIGGGSATLAALLPVVLGMLASRSSGSPSGGGVGDVLGGMMGGQKSNASSGGSLGDILGGMLGGQSGGNGMGGLGSLLEQFQNAGLGEQVKSWVGTGENLPISPDMLGKALGGDTLSKIASQAGLSEKEATSGLAQLLPEVVDHLTPGGQLPDLSQLTASVASLKRKFGA